MLVSPKKFMWWSSNPQCDGIWRWGLGEVIGVGWGHEGRAPIVGSVPLWEETPPQSSLNVSLKHTLRKSHVSTQWESSCLQAWRRAITTTPLRWHPDLGLPASRLWENKFLFLKPPSLWYLGMAARADQTLSQRVLLPASPRVCKQAARTQEWKLPTTLSIRLQSGQVSLSLSTAGLQSACHPACVAVSASMSPPSPAQPIQDTRSLHLHKASPRSPSHLVSFQHDRGLPQTVPGGSFRMSSGTLTARGLGLPPEGWFCSYGNLHLEQGPQRFLVRNCWWDLTLSPRPATYELWDIRQFTQICQTSFSSHLRYIKKKGILDAFFFLLEVTLY